MTDHAESGHVDGSRDGNAEDGNCSVEAYETDDGTVLYDAWNPLAWIESSVTVTIDEAA